MKIAIIGGGMSGLGAAYELSKTQHSITLFEKNSALGGLVSSSLINNVPLENFYYHLFPTYNDFFKISRELGIQNKIFFKKAKTANFYNEKLYPFSTPLDLLRFSPINFSDRIKMGFYSAYLKFKKNWHDFENVTASEWLKTHFGESAYDIIWKPLLKAKFDDMAEKISMVWLWAKIYERPSKFGYFKGGFETFISSLKEYLEEKKVIIHLNNEIKTIPQDKFDIIVVAAPPIPFLNMSSHILPNDYITKIKQLKYMGVVCLKIISKYSLTPYYWINIQDSLYPFVGIIEQTNFVPLKTYGEYHPIYVSRYLNTQNPVYNFSDEEIKKLFITYLKKIQPKFEENWIVESQVFKSPFAQHIVPSGYKTIKPTYKTPVKNLWWVSMSHTYPWDRGTNHSFRMGRELAQEILNKQY